MLKAEFVCRESFTTLHELQAKLNDYVHWHSHFRLRSKPGYVSPVEFRNAGFSL
jgi:putative transposase